MTTIQLLAVVGTLVTLAATAGGLYAVFKSAAQDARIKRLQDERNDYLSRLDYIEPKFKEIEEQNKLLRELHNPTAQLDLMDKKTDRVLEKQDKVMDVLNQQSQTLVQIHDRMPAGGS